MQDPKSFTFGAHARGVMFQKGDEGMAKNIVFTGKYTWDSNTNSVSIQVEVDGKLTRVLISIEALADHFGHVGGNPEDAYTNNKDEINKKATAVIENDITTDQGEYLITTDLVDAPI